jgi:hypothetical protein
MVAVNVTRFVLRPVIAGINEFIGSETSFIPSATSWDSSADTYITSSSGPSSVHTEMKRCLLLDDGTVNYYLSPTDSTKKANGTDADLTGADGMVMVEIPKFYTKREVNGDETSWFVSKTALAGYSVHPAFIKNGVEVNYRYYSAYDACYLDATDGLYKSGLNLDNLSASLDLAADKLSSVSGIYPIVGVLRSDCRTLASNRGTGWRQLDFALWSAVQLLYLTEYGTFNSQSVLGAGNTGGTYVGSSSDQNQSPHTIAGASNSLGNGSTNTTTGAAVNAKPGTSFMCYRGIENFYGNCWNWADGINVNVTTAGNVHVTNNQADFADNTSTNMTLITSSLPTASGFIRNLLNIDDYFLSSTNSGGSSTTYITDQHFASAGSGRVVVVGGAAVHSASAGAFCLFSQSDSSNRNRTFGGRLAF